MANTSDEEPCCPRPAGPSLAAALDHQLCMPASLHHTCDCDGDGDFLLRAVIGKSCETKKKEVLPIVRV